jgi:YD repeat-containing protein
MKPTRLFFRSYCLVLSIALVALSWTASTSVGQESTDQATPTSMDNTDETAASSVEAAPPVEDEFGGGESMAAMGGSPPTDVAPTGTSAQQVSGDILNYQTDLFTGRFTYRVPILVPPGRGGSQPDIALRYSSSAGNGWCGMGWLLDMGYIERDTSDGVPRKWSGTSPVNEYDDNYGFVYCYAGEKSKLVYVGGANNNEYRVAVEQGAFLKFEYVDPHWKVTDKAGNQFFFGETSAARMENPNWTGTGSALKTYRWALSKVSDVNGNETDLTYTTDNSQLYLSEVRYNRNINTPSISASHIVTFVLEDRVDKSITFLSGYRVTTAKRLKEIQVKINTTNVRKYVLNYTSSPSTYRSLLGSITPYGSDFTSTLPPLTFSYQAQQFQFDALTDWTPLNSLGNTNAGWNSVRASTRVGSASTYVEFLDANNDGFPDRVLRDWWREWEPECQCWYYFVDFYYQQNTGTNFNSSLTAFGNPYTYSASNEGWSSLRFGETGATIVELADINGDNRPDRFMRALSSPYNTWTAQYKLGSGLSSAYTIGPITNESSAADWRSIRASYPTNYVDFIDMNGDGVSDRVARKLNSSYDRFKIQFGTGTGFGSLLDWTSLDSQGQPNNAGWNSVFAKDGGGATFVGLFDLNGDGLPDRVMRKLNTPYDNFVVQFNNGAGFETAEHWGPLNSQGDTSAGWNSPIGTTGLTNGVTYSTLADINGDGLLDRVMRKSTSPYDRFKVQLNTGTGFTNSLVDWTGVASEAGSSSIPWNSVVAITNRETYVDFVDVNGDGLGDRVMRKLNAPYDRFKVQLNKGPFPDLLSTVQNGIGGKVEVSYIPATKYDNRDGPGTTAASLLGYPFYTVSKTIVYDGFGSADTNTYAYANGVASPKTLGGFHRVTATDPLGAKTITYFHQNGGTNDTINGEYQDQNAQAKIGIPYRVEVWGSDGLKYKQTINKVDEVLLHTNGWAFPFIAQTISMDYEGLSSYRATAQQFSYAASSNVVTSTGNLTNQVSLGEVSSVVITNHTFTDIGNDSLYMRLAYNSQSKPTNVAVFADSGGATKLRESRFTYDSRGNLTAKLDWLNTSNSYVTNSIGYDQYGNATSTTNPVGIVSRTIYESTYQTFPVTQITATFTNQATFDVRSGQIVTATDAKGLVSSNAFDVFYRPKEAYISTNAYGAAVLWRTKLDYTLGGIGGGVSTNYVRRRVFDAVDTTNGHETYTYFDGFGRTAQVRVEAETGQYRVMDTFYNERGQNEFVTLPYFSSGTAFSTGGINQLGALTAYDAIGRIASNAAPAYATGSLGSDTGSPVGWTQFAYKDGSTLWTAIVTDSEGKAKKSVSDAYGRVTNIVEVVTGGNQYTSYQFDKVGNLTNVTDNAGNKTWMNYDSLGRKTSMTEPNMGTWTYSYDAAGRMTEQIDAKNQKLKFIYNDAIGRLTSKEIYNSSGSLQATITYTYDTSDDGNYSVFKGQLYKVTDRVGWQKLSYDVRGRVL